MAGCGHGECAPEGVCEYDPGAVSVRWDYRDLDRCEHGRHSIDSCFDCPEGHSHGNPFLLSAHSGQDQVRHDSGQSEIRVQQRDGRTEVRIGTMVRGEPIWVVVRDKERSGSSGN